MSVSAIASSSNLFSALSPQSTMPPVQRPFQELVQGLESGDLAEAQQGYGILEQESPSPTANPGSSPLHQAFSALGQALQSGNLAAARTDFSSIMQMLQHDPSRTHHHHHDLESQLMGAIAGAATAVTAGLGASLPAIASSIDLTA